MKTNFQEMLINELSLYIVLLKYASEDVSSLLSFFSFLGWDINTLNSGNNVNFENEISNIVNQISEIDDLIDNPPTTLAELKTALNKLGIFVDLLGNLSNTFVSNYSGIYNLPSDIINGLFILYISKRNPLLYKLFDISGIIQQSAIEVEHQNGVLVRVKNVLPQFIPSFISEILEDPTLAIQSLYWPDGLNTLTEASATGRLLFGKISNLLTEFQIDAYVGDGSGATQFSSVDDLRISGMMYLFKNIYLNSQTLKVGASFGILPADENGPGLFVVPIGTFNLTKKIGDYNIDLSSNASIDKLEIQNGNIDIISTAQEFDLKLKLSRAFTNAQQIGSVNGTRVEISEISILLSLIKNANLQDYGIALDLNNLSIIISKGDGDGFINKIFPSSEKNIKIDLSIGWSKGRGIYFKGSGGLEIKIPISEGGDGKTLNLTSAKLGFLASNTGIYIYAAASGNVKLGPITLLVETVGLNADLSFPSNGGNLGPVNAEIGFKPPTGVGIDINSSAVKGGGYLSFDYQSGNYSGVGMLSIKDQIKVKVVGLLSTKLPNNQPGYSLFLLVTVEDFNPLQLGMGFTLNGVGGLVGIHRNMNVSTLRTGLKDGSLDYLLFPANPVQDAPVIINSIDNVFPIAEGRYAFGLMGIIGWGTPTLITMKVGLLISVPDPITLAIAGVIRILLPNESEPTIKIQVNFLGVIDFEKQRISFDASLFDSRVQDFVISGDMAFRLFRGQNPVFLLTAGGFHPLFQPPAAASLGIVNRLAISFSNSNSLRLRAESYFAVTSNTVQIGCRIDAYVRVADFWPVGLITAEGYLGFDALFRFNPFKVLVELYGGFCIKRNGSEFMAVDIRLRIQGPKPWTFNGKATLTICRCDVDFEIDARIGSSASSPPQENVDLRTLLIAALENNANWEATLPAANNDLVSTKPPVTSPGSLVINPASKLSVRQKVMPLDFWINKYGNKNPVNGNEFDVRKVEVGSAGPSQITLLAADLTKLTEQFSPGEFSKLTDAQKLSRKSFELMQNGISLDLSTKASISTWAFAIQEIRYDVFILEHINEPRLPVLQQSDPVEAGMFRQMAAGGAISQSSLSRTKRAPSSAAPPAAYWDQEGYTVATADTMEPYNGSSSFSSQAEAYAYLEKLQSQFPELKNELQVIANYEIV